MIYFEKSQPAPACLANESLKASGDYKCGDVLHRLKEDFKGKCYICESKNPTSINVEHFRPKSKYADLKFDWNNLFWACGHCNQIKGSEYVNIIDCTDPQSNIEGRLIYNYVPMPYAKVTVIPRDETLEAQETSDLLNAVYNGTTILKQIEAENLRGLLVDNFMDFQKHLRDYYFEDNTEECKIELERKIAAHLRSGSAFTAIKRSYLRATPRLLNDFGKYFN